MLSTLLLCLEVLLLASFSSSARSNYFASFASKPDTLSDQQLYSIDRMYSRANLRAFTDPLFVVRHVNSGGHEQVRHYLYNFLKARKWVVEEHVFQGKMPNDTSYFEGANIIASSNPVSATTRRIILACHWDSKYDPQSPFIGATDSAVPCGMLLWLADALQPMLADRNNQNLLKTANVALQLVFFDGEEAIISWTDNDSLYGSRSLAEKWARENKISTIDLFVLLDLLGAPGPKFYSFFSDTHSIFKSLGHAESRLSRLWSSKGIASPTSKSIFNTLMSSSGYIQDDHIPFMQRGVPIVHLIPYPFPEVWHTALDTEANIDWPTVDRFSRILAVFTFRHLNALILANNHGQNNILIVPEEV